MNIKLNKNLKILIILLITIIIGIIIISMLINMKVDKNIEPEKPVLDSGMIPVVISDDGTVTTISENDDSWYNYDNKQWANVVLVNSESREKYLETSGKIVNQTDILAYYVWIPRFKYKGIIKKCSELDEPSEELYPECYTYKMDENDKTGLILWYKENTKYHYENAAKDINELLETGKIKTRTIESILKKYNQETQSNATYKSSFNKDNKLNPKPRPIDIVFEKEKTRISKDNIINDYITHPAFIWGNKTISGFWAGKFETSAEVNGDCYKGTSEYNCENIEPRILPNVKSLTHQNISEQFETSLKFNRGLLLNGKVTFAGNDKYGLTIKTDSHMMKNSEWTAIAYLSHSKYGKNNKIEINNYDKLTGYGKIKKCSNSPSYYLGLSFDGVPVSSSNGVPVSSSNCEIDIYKYGEETVYPQSTTGNISGIFDTSGGNSEYVMGLFGNLKYDDSGFKTLPPSKYYDSYKINYNKSCKADICIDQILHELYETRNWYDDDSYFKKDGSWISRGEKVNFSYSNSEGNSTHSNSWRSTLITFSK